MSQTDAAGDKRQAARKGILFEKKPTWGERFLIGVLIAAMIFIAWAAGWSKVVPNPF